MLDLTVVEEASNRIELQWTATGDDGKSNVWRFPITDTGLGEPSAYVPTPGGALASFDVGPFTDDVVVEVEPAPQGSVVWIRSASRTGRSDLGVNARRAARIVDALAGWLPPEAMD